MKRKELDGMDELDGNAFCFCPYMAPGEKAEDTEAHLF